MNLRAIAVAALLLAGCGSTETASYLILGNDLALTLERSRDYAWSEGYNLEVVLRQNPECQRRYPLKPTATANLKVEVYSPERGVFILRQGKRWYVAELKTCQLQAFKEAPPEPGELIGSFRDKDGAFRFVEAKRGEAPAAAEGG